MSFFPDRSTFVSFGNLSIRWYAILILTGALFVYWRMSVQLKKCGYSQDDADNLFLGCLTIGILGARIWYVLFSDLSSYLADPVSIFKVWEGGLGIHGGLICGILFALGYCRKRKMDFFRVADCVLPYVLIAQAVGRWGNFLNQEAFGQPVSEEYFAPWPSFLNFIKEGMYIHGSYQEPMFFYESCLCVLGFVLIMLYRKYSNPKRGDLVYCYVLWYGEKDRSDYLMIGNLKMAQVISVLFMLIGLAGLLGAFRKFTKAKKPVLLFDNDGTLVDTAGIIRKSFEDTFAKLLPQHKLTEEELDSFMGPTLEESFRRFFPPQQVASCVETYRQTNNELLKNVEALPEVKEHLKKWHEAGYRMAIVSVKRKKTIEEGLEYAGIDKDLFEVITGPEEVSKPKPDPEGIFAACAKMNVSHDDVVYVGDSPIDVQMAKNAGVYSIGFASDPGRKEALAKEKPNKLITSFGQIDEVLKENISWSYNQR